MGTATQGTGSPDLYLPTGALTLMTACASALANRHPAEIIYLEDGTKLPATVRAALTKRFPTLNISCQSDAAAIAAFANLPSGLPALLRRNIALGRFGWPLRPDAKPPVWLGPQYRDAYLYLTGNFTAKTLRRKADRIILREEGLGSSYGLPFGWPKAILRALSGRSPRRQIMGEEAWVDLIEISDPTALPPKLRRKSRALGFAEIMGRLPPAEAQGLARAFWDGPTEINQGRVAVLLSQPIDRAGLCSTVQKRALFADVAGALERAGYDVVLKPHPHETQTETRDHASLPAFFPVEAWPWLGAQPFDLAVGLCTSALEHPNPAFSRQNLQLIDPAAFRRGDFSAWPEALAQGLRRIS